VRLLFLTPAFPPFTGGGERYAQALALALAGRGHPVTIISSQARSERDFWEREPRSVPAGPSVEQREPLTVIRCPLRPLPGGQAALLLWRKAMVLLSLLPGDQSRWLLPMARYIPPITHLAQVLDGIPPNFDLVHGFNLSWEHTLVAGRRFAARHRLPYVITPFAHFGESSSPVSGRRGRRSQRVARNATMDHQRWLLESAAAVLALTQVEEKGFQAWNIHPTRVGVVGGGLDPVENVAEPGPLLARHRLQTPFAIFVGRINYDKGAIHAAEAIRRLRQTGVPLPLALVGRQTEQFRHYYQQLPAADRALIRPLGSLDDAEKHALLQEATMLLLPSRADSFGIVLLEAWFHGTPVVGARAGGIATVIDDEEDGLLIPFGDVGALAHAIQRLLADPAYARRLGRQGQKKVRQTYTWERVADRVLDHYRALLPAGEG